MKSVLIVDDEPTVRKVVTETLSDTEFSFIEADNAAQALRTLREAGPNISVLVTDVRMPGQLNGIDLAKLTQNSWPWIKVIVTTGFPDAVAGKLPANVASCLSHGGPTTYWTKFGVRRAILTTSKPPPRSTAAARRAKNFQTETLTLSARP
jgi:CheY-like chemotaxis protein